MRRFVGAISAAALVAACPAFAADRDNTGSDYLKCDGQPNNMSGTEGFARFMGAITLLGLFAPAREQPDASKRLFGTEGVAACSRKIDGVNGENREENGAAPGAADPRPRAAPDRSQGLSGRARRRRHGERGSDRARAGRQSLFSTVRWACRSAISRLPRGCA
jgi:hypothetical protein